MRTVVALMAVALAALFILGGCGGGPGVPMGSSLKGEYKGPFNSQFSWGTITVRVYDAPDGSRPVSGEFDPRSGDARGIFKGQMKGSQMEATFLEARGTVTGEMSADGQTMSGNFSFANVMGPPGTWTANKK